MRKLHVLTLGTLLLLGIAYSATSQTQIPRLNHPLSPPHDHRSKSLLSP